MAVGEVAEDDVGDGLAVGVTDLRQAVVGDEAVLALGNGHGLEATVETWKRRHPDVHIYPVSDGADVVHFLKKRDERVQLAVIGGSQAGELAQIVGPYGHRVFHHTESSVLIVRH